LDNVVYRMGFAPSRNSARQLIRHGHIRVNERKVNIPSFLVSSNDEIVIKEKSRTMPLVQETMETTKDLSNFDWFEVDKDNFKGKVLSAPSREQIPMEIDERLIVEFYSK